MSPSLAGRVVERSSGMAFEKTVESVLGMIERAGMQVFARIDHAAAARAVGLEMPATLVLLYGNPAKGTPLMLAAPEAALELPLRVLVREAAPGGDVLVSYRPVGPELQELGVPGELAATLEPAQRLLLQHLG